MIMDLSIPSTKFSWIGEYFSCGSEVGVCRVGLGKLRLKTLSFLLKPRLGLSLAKNDNTANYSGVLILFPL